MKKAIMTSEAAAKGGVKKTPENHDRAPAKPPAKKPREITDLLFLDSIRDALYEMLASGAIELKLDSGFKAIELKHKISEHSRTEDLFLELLNELRSQELIEGDSNKASSDEDKS